VNIESNTTDRRSSDRFSIEREVRYKVLNKKSGEESGMGVTINMSSTGVLFTTDQMLLPGRRIEVSISWPAQLNNKCALRLVARGRVVRFDDGKAMNTEILKGVGAFSVLRRKLATPSPGRIIGAAMKVDRDDLTDAAVANDFHTTQYNRVEPSGVNHAQSTPAGFGGCDHPFALFRRLRHRFFDQHVHTCLQGLD